MIRKQILEAVVLLGTIGLVGCTSSEYRTGTIERETGTATQIVESRRAAFGNESVRFGDQTYILQIRTAEGLYTASVDQCDQRDNERTIGALATALHESDRVRFCVVRPWPSERPRHPFGRDKIGRLCTSEIELLSRH